MSRVIDLLTERGFIEALTDSERIRSATEKPVRIYCGFDPTADSLHLGNLVAIMGLAWFQKCGHTPVAIVGGATGMIGDPSGKSAQRQLLDESTVMRHSVGIRKNLETVLDFHSGSTGAVILNNFDWYRDVSFIRFLREIGSMFRLGPMLSKDSVKSRLQSEEGMSFTEFSYQILQGYDFLHLYRTEKVTVQLGGSDQWGNITAGTELIRRAEGGTAFGITFPLLTKSDGQKFGKSEKGAVWLSPDKLSPYEFYQYLIRTEDADVIKLMRMLTFMDMAEISLYEKRMKEPDYMPRSAQKKLAEELTRLIHSEAGLSNAVRVTEGIAPGSKSRLDARMLEELALNMPSSEMPFDRLHGMKLIELLVETGLQPSKGEARRLIRNGGVTVNNEKIEDENYIIDNNSLIDQSLLLLAAGKKNKLLVRVKRD